MCTAISKLFIFWSTSCAYIFTSFIVLQSLRDLLSIVWSWLVLLDENVLHSTCSFRYHHWDAWTDGCLMNRLVLSHVCERVMYLLITLCTCSYVLRESSSFLRRQIELTEHCWRHQLEDQLAARNLLVWGCSFWREAHWELMDSESFGMKYFTSSSVYRLETTKRIERKDADGGFISSMSPVFLLFS